MKKRVADILFDTLLELGITDCFAVVGGGAMHLDNALALQPKIKKYFNHHEQACAMAAEAYARYCGKIAAVVVTSGPGGTNTLTGVMGAWVDSIPMMIITGQVRQSVSVEATGLPLRYRGVQEFDIINTVGKMTKYAVMIKDPLDVKRQIYKAYSAAMSGRRGPVWLDIPMDVQSAVIETEQLYQPEDCVSVLYPNEKDMEWVENKLNSAKRPLLLGGRGVVASGNLKAFGEFAHQLGIPVISGCISADNLYMEDRLFYGMAGSIGPRPGNFIVQNADVVLSVGCSLGVQMTGFAQEKFAPNACIIDVDVDKFEYRKPGIRVDKFLNCDISAFLNNAMGWHIKVEEDWINYCDRLKNRFSPFEPGRQKHGRDERVCMYYFWEMFAKYEPEDSICALGNNTANSAKLQIGVQKKDQRVLTNKNCGSMGYDLPAAIGAAVASGKSVFCITGDGSIMMNLQELQTIRHYDLPVKVVVCANDGYNAIRQTSKNFFDGMLIGCTPETGVSFPDFEKIAKAFDMEYRHCRSNGELEDALRWFFAAEGRVVLEVDQLLDDPVTPKVMSRMREDGTFATPALQDMAPFLDEEEYNSFMLW